MEVFSNFKLTCGDTMQYLQQLQEQVDMILADPPYFISGGGKTIRGKRVVVANFGEWDKIRPDKEKDEFNYKWLSLCRERLKDNGTIWVSGTFHNIYSVARCMTDLECKVLSVITWQKLNPPPSLTGTRFNFSAEFIIWAAKSAQSKYFLNFNLMTQLNGHFVVDSDTNPERLIIHYYKTMSKHEAKPITNMLNTLGLNIPVLIVTINKTETSDIVMFDEKQQGYMPLSGTVLKIRNDDFLLYNNSRYKENEKSDMLFPVRIRLSKIVNQSDKDIPVTDAINLPNQVYQFGRMYWKSVEQQNLPITIKYPEMVAEIVPHFSEAELPQFGKNNLWFL